MGSNWLVEIVKRARTGPFMKEGKFDLEMVKRTRQLVKEYGIESAPEAQVPSDNGLADRVFAAGLQLFVDLGVYCQSTERTIRFTRGEVLDAIHRARVSVTLGEGKDAVVMRHREVEEHTPPVVHSGPCGTPVSERYHPLILLSCAQEPLVDCLGAGSVSTYFGERISPGTPLEILGARRDAAVAREAVRMAGRPGMHINDVALPLTCAGKMAAFDQEMGLRRSDGILVSQMINVKTDMDQLSRVAHLYNIDGVRVGLMHPMIGGVGGGAEGSAVVAIACVLLSIVLYDADYHMFSPGHLRHSNNVDPAGAWLNAVCGQALARNTRSVMLNDIFTVSGPGTKDVLYEAAVGAVVGTICGFHIQGVGTASGFNSDVVTGLEARFIAEVSRAVINVGLTRDQASDLIPELQERFLAAMENPDRGRQFAEVYDEQTVEPRPQWLDLYSTVKDELTHVGLRFGEPIGPAQQRPGGGIGDNG